MSMSEDEYAGIKQHILDVALQFKVDATKWNTLENPMETFHDIAHANS